VLGRVQDLKLFQLGVGMKLYLEQRVSSTSRIITVNFRSFFLYKLYAKWEVLSIRLHDSSQALFDEIV
jgi:hypothetical protein